MLKALLAALFIALPALHAQPVRSEGPSLPPLDQNLLVYLGIEDSLNLSQRALDTCDRAVQPTWVPETCPLTAYVDKYTRPALAEEILGDAPRIVYFGETHISQGSKVFLREFLPELKAKGYSVLAMEMFNASQQPVLDAYNEGRAGLDTVERALADAWQYEGAEYIRLIAAAHALGVRVLALDVRDRAPKLEFIQAIHWRDEYMAQNLTEELSKSPTVKIFALTGALHAQCILSQTGAILSQSQLVQQATGIQPRCLTLNENERLTQPAGRIYFRGGEKTQPGFLPLDRRQAYADGYILLPKGYGTRAN